MFAHLINGDIVAINHQLIAVFAGHNVQLFPALVGRFNAIVDKLGQTLCLGLNICPQDAVDVKLKVIAAVPFLLCQQLPVKLFFVLLEDEEQGSWIFRSC